MAITSETSTCAMFQFKWKLSEISEPPGPVTNHFKTITFRQHKLFRVAIDNRRDAAKLFLTATNLNKFGIKVLDVTCEKILCYEERWPTTQLVRNKMAHTYNKDFDESEIGTVQFFTSSLPYLEHDRYKKEDVLFKIYITGTSSNYVMQRTDELLKEQIWSSAQNVVGTDFEVIAEGKKFPVHKFILAARSSVFAHLFETKEGKFEKGVIIEADVICTEQFLKFIYTGELEGPIGNLKLLMNLAEKYQIKTLETLCQSTIPYVEVDAERNVMKLWPDIEKGSDFLSNTMELRYMWNLDKWVEEWDCSKYSEKQFEFQKGKSFLAKLQIWERYNREENGNMYYVLTLRYDHDHNTMNYRVDEVAYSMDGDDNHHLKRIKMEAYRTFKSPNMTDPCKCFVISGYLPPILPAGFAITFYATFNSTVPNFEHNFVDSTCKEQFWAASTNKIMTDVQLLIGEESFYAHRSILSARSPVFAAMFASGMKECITGQVLIEDVEPSTFRHFMEFIYTGSLATEFEKEELFLVADKYQVETLIDLCKPVLETEIKKLNSSF